jgi:hypothetical protein
VARRVRENCHTDRTTIATGLALSPISVSFTAFGTENDASIITSIGLQRQRSKSSEQTRIAHHGCTLLPSAHEKGAVARPLCDSRRSRKLGIHPDVIRHEIGYSTLQARGTGLMCVTGEFTLTKTKNVRRHECGYTTLQVRGS